MSFTTQSANLRTAILAFATRVKELTDAAGDAATLEGLTLNQVVDLIRGATLSTTADVETFLNAFIARQDNPHNVTKAQVGLGDVQNFAIATSAEAIDSLNAVKYMTPQRTWDALAEFWAQQTGAAPETLNEIHEIAAALQNNPEIITVIQDQVALKATKDELNTAVSSLSGDILLINTALAGKAEQTALSALSATVDTKADQTALNALSTTVDTKASIADVTTSLTSMETAFQDALTILG